MNPINGIKIDPTITQRLDINANVTPNYLINQEQLHFQGPQIGATGDFPAAILNAKNVLANLRNSLNYIANLEIGNSAPPPPPPPTPPTPGSNPPTGSSSTPVSGSGSQTDPTGGAGTAGGVAGNALNAADDLLAEADAQTNELTNKDWTVTDPDTGYQYIDPEFFVAYEKLNALLIALQIIGMVLDTLRQMNDVIQGNTAQITQTLSDITNSVSELASISFQSRMLYLSEAVTNNNQNLLTYHTTTEADDKSWNSYNGWDVTSEVVTSGGSDAMSRHDDKTKAEWVYKQTVIYENFQNKVMSQYENVLGNSALYSDGITKMGNIFESLGSGGLINLIGGGKWDIDRNTLTALQMNLTGAENYRRLLFMLQEAKMQIISIIVEDPNGPKLSSKIKKSLDQVVDSLDKFEGTVFSNMSYQLQTTIAGDNMMTDAYNQMDRAQALYDSSATLGSIPLIGGITKNWSDYYALEFTSPDLDSKPTQLDMNEVYQILANMLGLTQEQVQQDFSAGNGYAEKLKALEDREWTVIGSLSDPSLINTRGDGTQEINSDAITALQTELNSIQTAELIVGTLVNMLARIDQIILGLDTSSTGKEVNAAIKGGIQTRSTAFDLKLAGINSDIDVHNKKVKEAKMLEKSGWVALGSFGMAAVAVGLLVLNVVCPPTFILTVGFLAACAQLGASLAQIIFNSLNPVDTKIYFSTEYFDELDKMQDTMDGRYDAQIDRIDENAYIGAGNDQWVKDTQLLMDVRDQLTRVYIYEQIVLLLTQARANIHGLIDGAGPTDSDLARSGISNRFATAMKAYDNKTNMLEHIIDNHNMAVKQEKETDWAIGMAVISALEIVCSGVGSSPDALGSLSETFNVSIDSLMEGSQWGAYGLQIVNGVVTAVKAGIEGSSGYDELTNFESLIQEIDAIASTLEGEDADSIRAALGTINTQDMVESTGGGGKVTANASNYYAGIRSMQRMFNRIICMMQLVDTISRIHAKMTGGISTGGASEGLDAVKSSTLKQLDLLFDRIKAYVTRTNDMADAWRQFTIAVVMLALKIFMKVAEKNNLLAQLKSWLTQVLKDAGFTGEIKIFDNPKIAKFLVGNDAFIGNGTLNAGSLASILVDVAFSKELITFITRKIYDSAASGNKKAKEVQWDSSSSNAQIDKDENQAFANQLSLAKNEVADAMLEIAKQLRNELNKFWTSEIHTVIQGALDKSWTIDTDVLKLSGSLKELKALDEHLLIDLSKKLDFSKIDWNNRRDVEKAFARVAKYLEEASDLKGKKLTEAQKKAVISAAAIMIAGKIAKLHRADPTAFNNIKGNVAQQLAKGAAADKAYTRMALAILGALTKNLGLSKNPALSAGEIREVDNLIHNVWRRVAVGEISEADALMISDNVKSFRPGTFQISYLSCQFYKSGKPAELPRELQQALSALNLEAVDFTNPAKVKEALGEVQKLSQETKINGQPLSPKQKQDLIITAAIITAEKVALEASSLAKVKKAFTEIVRDPNTSKNKALLEYANAVLGRMALADVSLQISALPQSVQTALMENTNLGSVDWTDPNKVREAFANIQRFVREGRVEDKLLTPSMQKAVMSAATIIVAAQINADPDQKLKAMAAFSKIVLQQKSGEEKPLVDFANAVLTQVAEAEKPEVKKAAKQEAAAKAKAASNIENIIYRMYGRVKAMEWAVFDKKKDPAEQFSLLKVDTRRMIQLLPTKDLGINLPAVLQQVAKAGTPEEMARILENLLNNPKIKLSVSARKYLKEMIGDLKEIDQEMKKQGAAAKKPAGSQRPVKQQPVQPQAMAPSMRNYYADYDRRTISGTPRNSKEQKIVNTRDTDRLVAVGQSGNRGNGNGPKSNDKGGSNYPTKHEPKKPQLFADVNVKPNGNGSYLNAEEAVKRTLAHQHNGNNGNHKVLS